MFGLTPYNSRKSNCVVRREPEFFDIDRVFKSFFDDTVFGGSFGSGLPAVFGSRGDMKVDIKETDKEYTVEAELPGINKEEINLELRDDTFTISVKRDEQVSDERDNYIRRERRYGSFARSFYVENIKQEDISAKFENGILSVTLPKSEVQVPKSRKIDIH